MPEDSVPTGVLWDRMHRMEEQIELTRASVRAIGFVVVAMLAMYLWSQIGGRLTIPGVVGGD